MSRGEKNGRAQGTNGRNRISETPKLCEVCVVRYFNDHHVRSIMRAGYAGGSGNLREKQGGFFEEELGIEGIPSKATFGRILSMVDGKQVGEVILSVLRERFGTEGEVIAVDGKAICSTAKGRNPHSALQILSAYVTESGITLAQETIHEKTNEIPVFSGNAHIFGCRGQDHYGGCHALPAGNLP